MYAFKYERWDIFLYSNFSFPLLFLVTILIFREEISSVLTRIKTIKYSGSAGEVSFILNNIKQLGDDMESLKIVKFVDTEKKY